MGVEYRAVLVVGKPYSELVEDMNDEENIRLDERIDGEDLDLWSPYFDAPREDSVLGFVVSQSGDYCSVETSLEELAANESQARSAWNNAFPNVEPSLYLMPYGW